MPDVWKIIQNKEVKTTMNHAMARLKLLGVIKDRNATPQQQRYAEQLYESVGTGACDLQTIERFVLYRRLPESSTRNRP